MHLRTVKYLKRNNNEYPYNLPLFHQFEHINFDKQVTILVGENGTGKSTLLDAIATSAQLIRIGFLHDERKAHNRMDEFSKNFKLTWNIRTRNGFYLTSEDFIGYIKQITEMKKTALEELETIKDEFKNKSEYAKGLASMPHNRTLGELKQLYGEGLEVRSHGESYLDFFHSRFKPNGLFILDEPEVPLSPLKQLSLISMIKQMTGENAQFIIATHSPILMAIPDAEIISLDTHPISSVKYDELEHVKLTKSFLNNPESYLRHL